MRPNFALLILPEGLDLLHRSSPGWERVGGAAFDDPDLGGALARLRDLGQALDPAPMRTKLVLPNDQIRYLSVFTGTTTEADRRALVMAELDGATPYALEELSICWSVSGTTTHVAAVARETLEEAETFATEHGLNPVSFVGIPGENSYLGEPFFGPTRLAATLLGGDTVERDAVQVHILGDASLPSAIPPEPAPTEAAAAEDQPVAAPDETLAEIPPAPEPSAPAEEVAAAEQDIPSAQKDPAAPPPEAELPPVTFRARRDLFDLEDEAAPATPPAPSTPPVPSTPPDPATPPAPATPASAKPNKVKLTATRKAKARPAAPGAEATPGFTSVRASRAEADTAATPKPGTESPAKSDAAPADPKATVAATKAALSAPTAADATTAPQVTGPDLPPTPAAGDSLLPPDTAENQRAREAEQMTVFGARGPAEAAPDARKGGRRRVVLLAAAVVLLGLGGWALLGRGTPEEATPDQAEQTAALPPEDVAPGDLAPEDTPSEETAAISTPAALEPRAAGKPQAVAEPEASPEEATEETAEATPAPRTSIPMDIRPAPATPAEAAARYAATGIWQRAPQSPVPPVATELGEIEVASVTPAERVSGVTGLADTTTEIPLADISAPPNPPAPEQTFTLDDRGLVTGTEDGALTPEGHLVFSGPPPVVPPTRPEATLAPGTVLPAAASQPAPEEITQDATDTAEAPAEAAPEEETETVATAPEDQLRPRRRPEGLAPEVDPEAAPEPEAEATAATDPDLEIDLEAIESASDLAADAALRPRPRPEDFAALVAAAQAAAALAPAPAPAPVQTPSVSAPGPVTASVARQATEERAINLNRINLIGVSGDPSARAALVRLSDGRIRKVEVGDRLDGGRVAAIGDGNLRYVKGSRTLTLEMPD